MAEPMPWWMAGMLLGGIAVTHLALTGRLLSISGIVARALRWRDDEAERQSELAINTGSLDDELLRATLAAFGGEAEATATATREDSPANACDASARVRLPISAGAAFLVAVTLGGALSTGLDGSWQLRLGLGSEFSAFYRSPALQLTAAVLGGLCIGFGARMAGGCTSGHGLAGCARLQSGSLVATTAFFVSGILVSQLLSMVAR